jgi:tetratricopeptide (TPR) repeat protein
VSDFGFDAYALDDAEPAGHPHPLEIARDLIAAGKPHAALEVLSVHQEQLADDPEYLLLCSEAWRADGDTLRAQQALLGAARLAPEDPRPLQWLGELLAERGEHDKAERVLEKARAMVSAATHVDEALDAPGPEAEDDLIAFAERQERGSPPAPTLRQALLGAVVVAGVALLITGIARVTSTGDDEVPNVDASMVPASASQVEAPPTLPEPVVADPAPMETEEPELVPLQPIVQVTDVAVAAAPEPEVEPEPVPPARKPRVKSKPKASGAPQAKEPSAAVVQSELASMDPKRLTERADALYAQGHTGVAASYYRRALELDPDYAPALVGMGQSVLRAKKYSDAMRNASRALQLARGVDARPGLEAVAIYQMARVHYERGERDAARRLFRQSISLPGAPSEAWFYLGEALSSDNSPAARQAYDKYLQLVPEGHLAERARRAIQ